MNKQSERIYTVQPDPESSAGHVIVTDPYGRRWRIDKESADPEHRFTVYRLAAGWFGNLTTPNNLDG